MVIVPRSVNLGHSGYRFNKWTINGRPTLINEFIYYVAACERMAIEATRKDFLQRLGKPTKHGHLAAFFTAVSRSGLFEITKNKKNENVYKI